jgi:MerR family transcriptional regulator, light-induced transcriptional regulator
MQYFNIQVASQLSGVAPPTIRAWEKRYNAVLPERGENGHRLYSKLDIEKLTILYRLTDIGQSIGKIAHLQLDELKQVYSTLMLEPFNEKQLLTSHDQVDFDRILHSLSLALAAYKVDVISHELDKAKSILSPRDLSLKIIIPLFYQIGLKVERGELTLDQEHTLSALTTFYLAQMMGSHYQKTFSREDLIIIGAPEGELHQIGSLAACLVCIHYGLRFIYMGTWIPAKSLVEVANALKCRAILLGTTPYHLKTEKNLKQYLNNLSAELNTKTHIWLVGALKIESSLELHNKIEFFQSLNEFDEFLANF